MILSMIAGNKTNWKRSESTYRYFVWEIKVKGKLVRDPPSERSFALEVAPKPSWVTFAISGPVFGRIVGLEVVLEGSRDRSVRGLGKGGQETSP
jgi:hypothetical protein